MCIPPNEIEYNQRLIEKLNITDPRLIPGVNLVDGQNVSNFIKKFKAISNLSENTTCLTAFNQG